MTRYLLAVHVDRDRARPPTTDEESRRGYERVADLENEMRSANALVFSARLDDPATAVVVDASAGPALTTDGPFTESKEVIGGFYIIEAESREAAVAWASKTSAAIRMPIEVRPFWATSER